MALQTPLASDTAAAQHQIAQPITDAAVHDSTADKAAGAAKQPQEPVSAAAEQHAEPSVSDSAQNSHVQQASQAPATEPQPQVPSQLSVVCADTQGTLKLDFDKMRCVILYRGDCEAASERSGVHIIPLSADIVLMQGRR